jgi:hypothetical protein
MSRITYWSKRPRKMSRITYWELLIEIIWDWGHLTCCGLLKKVQPQSQEMGSPVLLFLPV